jgi:signal recognition particle subunit SRP72
MVGVWCTLKLSWHVVRFASHRCKSNAHILLYYQAYREGSYDVAFDLYNQLLDTAEPVSNYHPHLRLHSSSFKDSEEHSDILTNLQASQIHLDFINTGFLHALDSLPTSITSTLETAPPPQLPSVAVQHASDSTTVNTSMGLNSRAPKKVRMSRVPAGVIPGVTSAPDPERWLKKSERSTFGQGKRRKGPFGGGGATQGSASVDTPITQTAGSGHPSKTGGGKGKKKR